MFELDEKLAADTVPVTDFALCRVLLMKDANYPWLILVPALPGLRDLHDLPADWSATVMSEIKLASAALVDLFDPVKINVAALGNSVPQLHIHVVARRTDDPAWPKPIWGVVPAVDYKDGALERRVADIRAILDAA